VEPRAVQVSDMFNFGFFGSDIVTPMKTYTRSFTPALGRHSRTSSYDRVIALMTREYRWRGCMLKELAPKPGQTVLDIGYGTGSFAVMVKRTCPEARIIGIDPDPEVRRIAEAKARKTNVSIELITAFGDDTIDSLAQETIDVVTCSLVLHQCSQEMKVGILDNAYKMLRPAGRLLISDYGEQRTLLMSMLFNQVRMVDGYEDTKANKEGRILQMIDAAGFDNVEELNVTPTPTGSISLYRGSKPL